MRKLLLIFILTLTGFASPEYPAAIAKFCGNVVVREKEKSIMFDQIQAEGCEDAHFVHIRDGWYLAFGTRVLMED